jgi:cation/acetate symporter
VAIADMRQENPLSASQEPDSQNSVPLNGRAAFAMAAFALAIGLVALVDVIGAPGSVVELLVPIVTFAGLATIGLMTQTMRMSRFYVGQRAIPPQYSALAVAALGVALLLPFLPPQVALSSAQVAPMAILVGFGAGFALVAGASGPLMRKTGAYSIADLIAGRFANSAVRQIAALMCALTAALVALAGLQGAADALVQMIGLSREAALAVASLVILAMIVPGGVGGLTWSATAAAVVLLAGLFAPLASAVGGDAPAPLPWLNDALFNAAASRVSQLHGQSLSHFPASQAVLATAAALGLASLAPLLLPAITNRGAAIARRAGWSSLLILTLIAVAAAAAMALSTLALDELLVGRKAQALPAAAYQASGHGLLTLCGQAASGPAAAFEACRTAGFQGVLTARDIWASGQYLLSAAPQLQGLSIVLTGLLAAGIAAVCLALAGAGAQAFGTAIAHDLLFAAHSSPALSSRRLAATRLCMIGLVILLAIGLAKQSVDPRALIAIALALSAACIAPLIALAVWPRANAADAMRAICAGLLVFLALVLVGIWEGDRAYGLAIASLAGFCAALSAGLALSFRRTAEETREGRAFLAGVLHGEADLLNRDRGA